MAKSSNAKAGKKLRGAVLSMVLIVMYVLIIMLMATLAVVSTAQNRSYSKFEENQAYYTARSALELFEANILEDSSYNALTDTHGSRTYTYVDENGVTQTANMSQGFGMQMDLFSIKAHAKTMQEYEGLADKENTFSSDVAANPTNANVPGQTFKYSELYSFGVVPSNDYIEYEVTMPDTLADNNLKKYGKYIESNTATTKAIIRVEVLARQFDDTGNHKKDEMFVKLTSKMPYQNTVGEVSTIVEISNPSDPDLFSNGITSFGAINGVDNATIIGGLSTDLPITFGNMGTVVGKIYCGGNATFGGGGSSTLLGKNEAAFIDGNYAISNNCYFNTIGITSPADPMENPIVFISGNVTYGSNLAWGKGSAGTDADKMTLICNDFTATSNTVYINGDLIVLGNLLLDGCTSFKVNGKVYVKGNMEVKNCNDKILTDGINSGYYIKGNLKFSDTDFVSSDIVTQPFYAAGSTKYMEWQAAANAYVETAVTGAASCSFVGYDFSQLDLSAAPIDPDKGAEITLPKVSGTSNVTAETYTRDIPVFTSAYSDYFTVEDTTPHNYVQMPSGENVIMGASIVNRVPESDREVGKYESPDPVTKPLHFNIGSIPIAYTSLNYLGGNINLSGEENFYLPGGSSNHNMHLNITGSGTANIYLQPGSSYSGHIYSDDAVTVNFLAPEGYYTWNVFNYNASVLSQLQNGVVKAGDAADALEAPQIYFYVDGDSTWDMGQDGWSMITGYFYGPSTTVNANKGADTGKITGVTSYSYEYDGGTVIGPNNTAVTANPYCIGAMIVGKMNNLHNQAVIVFVEPESVFKIPVVNGTISPIYSFTEYEYRAR